MRAIANYLLEVASGSLPKRRIVRFELNNKIMPTSIPGISSGTNGHLGLSSSETWTI
jgi:hypothetical protein